MSQVHLTQAQLESYLWGAATLLRGLIDAGDYKQLVFPLLFFKRLCDVYDEEIRRLVENAQSLALDLLRRHEAALHEVARILLDKEEISGREIERIADIQP